MHGLFVLGILLQLASRCGTEAERGSGFQSCFSVVNELLGEQQVFQTLEDRAVLAPGLVKPFKKGYPKLAFCDAYCNCGENDPFIFSFP